MLCPIRIFPIASCYQKVVLLGAVDDMPVKTTARELVLEEDDTIDFFDGFDVKILSKDTLGSDLPFESILFSI